MPPPPTAPVAASRTLTAVLIGNPNTGKSTLFNALSGTQSLTGNYPGCTVEKKIGKMKVAGQTIRLVDLPGTYSLSPRSLDEMVAVNVLLGQQPDVGRPDVAICIVDASNIERNLYLVSQVLDIGLPTVVVLNMCDVALQRGVVIDDAELSQKLGLPVIRTEAHRKRGISEVQQAVLALTAVNQLPPRPSLFPAVFQEECAKLKVKLAEWQHPQVPDYLLERLLLDIGGYLESHFDNAHTPELLAYLQAARQRLNEQGCRIPAVEARVRYAWARDRLQGVLTRPAVRPVTFSDKLDRYLTHRVTGLFVFVALMFIIFQAIYRGAKFLMDFCEAGQNAVSGFVASLVAPGPLRSLLIDGVIAGVGGVLVFLPQIVILFLFIALLEDCGYMARAAFLMDKLMTKVGLSGKSFVPLMSSFACAIPGVMATRVIENRRDRMTTILVSPLMSCSARQPVYALLIAGFIPATTYLGGWIGLQGLTLFAMTSVGALVAIPVAWLLKKTIFRGETPPFVMELPTYKWPSLHVVVRRVYSQAKAFVLRAGTLIFAVSIVIWALGYFPGDHTQSDALQVRLEALEEQYEPELKQRGELQEQLDEARATGDEQQLARTQAEVDPQLRKLDLTLETYDQVGQEKNALDGALLEQSWLGRFGQLIEPAVRPLGWDWKIGVGVIASFPAREVIISTLGTIYSLGSDVDEQNDSLREVLIHSKWPDGRPVFTIPVALSIMVFFALCAQCASTLMVIKRETNSWSWPLFTFVYMTTLAYLGAFAVYQIGTRLL